MLSAVWWGPAHTYTFSSSIKGFIPSRRVTQCALEIVQAWYLRPTPFGEKADRGDEDVGTVPHEPVPCLHLQVPFTFVLVPLGMADPMTALHIPI